MSYALPTFEERLKEPWLEIINFPYLIRRPELWPSVKEKYTYDYIFRKEVDEKRRLDTVFNRNFCEMFPGIDEEIEKNHLRK